MMKTFRSSLEIQAKKTRMLSNHLTQRSSYFKIHLFLRFKTSVLEENLTNKTSRKPFTSLLITTIRMQTATIIAPSISSEEVDVTWINLKMNGREREKKSASARNFMMNSRTTHTIRKL